LDTGPIVLDALNYLNYAPSKRNDSDLCDAAKLHPDLAPVADIGNSRNLMHGNHSGVVTGLTPAPRSDH
jgi:hypothetical protein